MHSTTFNIGLSSSKCTLSIVGLNAPNIASIAKDYKGLHFLDDYNIELYSSVANAIDNGTADQKVVTVQFKVNKK